MEWPDDEFEAFLRQFRPSKPKPLPVRIRPAVSLASLATAAVIVVAAVVIQRYGSKGPGRDSTQIPASAAPASTSSTDRKSQSGRQDIQRAATLNRVPDASAPAYAERGTAALSGSPARSPASDLKQPAVPPSNERVSAARGASNQRLRVGGAVKAPTKVVHVNPTYPEDAQAAGIGGIVILAIVIGEDGSVIETSVVRSIPELDQAAIDAVRQWQYEPTLLNGKPVEIEMNVTINFTLS